MSLRHLFTGPLLEQQIKQLTEDLVRERSAKDADRRAWEVKLSNLEASYKARIDALTDRMLLMAGVTSPGATVEVEEYENAHAAPPAIPGQASLLMDEFLEKQDEDALRRYWQQLQDNAAIEDSRETV